MKTKKQSTGQGNSSSEAPQDWLFDAFSEPRTMPTRWDLSEMSRQGTSERRNDSENQAADSSASQADDEASGSGQHILYLNPFPEPRTYPANWDLHR